MFSKRSLLVPVLLGSLCCTPASTVEAAAPAQRAPQVTGLQLVDNNHAPKKVVVIHSYGTAKFVKDLFTVIKHINESENLGEADRIKLHIVPSSGNPVSSLGISPADAEKYIEVNSKFSSSDIWAQDCMEICAGKTADGKLVPAVFDTMRGRGLAGLPKALSELWDLAYTKNPTTQGSHGDYGGNLEVAPFDNVMVAGDTITSACKSFWEKMGYAGRMFTPETQWLSVGHIDEYLGFIPTPHAPGGYSIVKADPTYGLDLIEAASDADFNGLNASDRDFLKRVKATLIAQRENPEAGRGTSEAAFIELNRQIGEIVEKNVGQMKEFIRKVTGQPDRDFAEVAWPSLYEGYGNGKPSSCHAYLPGVVNMLVLRNHLLVPACNFPPFDKIIEARFRAQGNHVHFIDDTPYHTSMGEIHCGTNVLRNPDQVVLTRAQVEAVQKVRAAFGSVHAPSDKGNTR